MFYRDERLALFIDGSNLYAATKALGFDIDYKLLRSEFMRRGKMVRAFYYTALIENEEYSPIRPLVDWLDYNGFTLVTKPAKEFTDSTGRRKIKGNMDIELSVDAMEMADHVEHIVLFSGDGDFRSLVAALQRKGVRVSVVSTIRSQPPMIADDLRRQADNFIELEELKDVIGRPPRPMPAAAMDNEVAHEEDEVSAARHRGSKTVLLPSSQPKSRFLPSFRCTSVCVRAMQTQGHENHQENWLTHLPTR